MLVGVLASESAADDDANAVIPPVDSTIIFDFVNEVYTVNGNAAAVLDLLGSTSGASYGPFDPTRIENGVGLKSPAEGGFLGDALTLILAGCTMIWEVTSAGSARIQSYRFDDPGFDSALFIDVQHSSSLVGDFDDTFSNTNLSTGANKVGATFEVTNIALSVNGAAATSKASPTITTPATDMSFALFGSFSATIVTKLTIMPPVLNADLPTYTV